MPKLVIADLTPKFPDFRVALVVAEGLAIAEERSPILENEIAAAEARCRERWSGVELSAIPGVAAWRAAYRAFGIKKTSHRSSVERPITRVLAGDRLPRVNALVDLYNMVSIESGFCLGCDDLDAIAGDLAFRFARPGDTFIDMGAGDGEDPSDPSKHGEVVYADANHMFCRRWNRREDARSLARRAVLTVQSNGSGEVAAAARRIAEGIAHECGGSYRIVVADRQTPIREF